MLAILKSRLACKLKVLARFYWNFDGKALRAGAVHMQLPKLSLCHLCGHLAVERPCQVIGRKARPRLDLLS